MYAVRPVSIERGFCAVALDTDPACVLDTKETTASAYNFSNGDGKGAFGAAMYPPASDLTAHDTQEKSDAQLFWIIKNGLSFAGMPAFGDQYSDQDIWNLVNYTRSLGQTGIAQPIDVPAATSEQVAMADPHGTPEQRGAAVYFSLGCNLCHGATGNAPGELRLRGAHEAEEAVREGRRGMPAFSTDVVSDAQLADMLAYINSWNAVR